MNKNNKYMTELQKSIEERTAEPCPNWMMPAVRTTASQRCRPARGPAAAVSFAAPRQPRMRGFFMAVRKEVA